MKIQNEDEILLNHLISNFGTDKLRAKYYQN